MKHRIPSPTREAGDGMEATKVTNLNQANSKVVEENVTQQQNVKLIKLPQTNISVEKLPPITDDKVKLPVTEPTSPLVLLSTGQPASKSLQGMYASIAHWSRMKSFCSENLKCQNCQKVLKTEFFNMFVIWSNHNDCSQGHKFQNYKPAILKISKKSYFCQIWLVVLTNKFQKSVH